MSASSSPAPATEALVALGGNVGDARATIARAVALFCDGPEVQLLARSADYRTPPWGVEDQPPFINAGIRIATVLPPHDLLKRALAVEHIFGRERSRETRWGPRSLDIDLIDYAGVSLDDGDLILPHPRALMRAFVLAPLAEIAPDWVIGDVTINAALARLDRSGIERLPPRDVAAS